MLLSFSLRKSFNFFGEDVSFPTMNKIRQSFFIRNLDVLSRTEQSRIPTELYISSPVFKCLVTRLLPDKHTNNLLGVI